MITAPQELRIINRWVPGALLVALLATGCDKSPAESTPPITTTAEAGPSEPVSPEPTKPAAEAVVCDPKQAEISAQADERAKPWSIAQHLGKNFPDMKMSWLMKETPYQTYVVQSAAKSFGRCDDSGCYLFAAPTAVIQKAVDASMRGETHDAAALGQALGLPAKNFEGPLRMMTIDLRATSRCVRLPVDSDPGVWKCTSADDKDCFKFGGYTSGNVPEVMVIDAPVDQTVVKAIP